MGYKIDDPKATERFPHRPAWAPPKGEELARIQAEKAKRSTATRDAEAQARKKARRAAQAAQVVAPVVKPTAKKPSTPTAVN